MNMDNMFSNSIIVCSFFAKSIMIFLVSKPQNSLHSSNAFLGHILCRNLSLGLVTKARACKGVGQEGSLGITFHAPGSVRECEGMNFHTPKWTPLWELESRWTLESSKSDYKGQNPLDRKVLYIIEKIL